MSQIQLPEIGCAECGAVSYPLCDSPMPALILMWKHGRKEHKFDGPFRSILNAYTAYVVEDWSRS